MKAMIQVGQTVWVESYGRGGGVEERVIASVGKKYFTLVGDHKMDRYHIDTMTMESQYSGAPKAHLTLKEILDRREKFALADKIRNAFSGYGEPKYTLEQLREVALILKFEQ